MGGGGEGEGGNRAVYRMDPAIPELIGLLLPGVDPVLEDGDADERRGWPGEAGSAERGAVEGLPGIAAVHQHELGVEHDALPAVRAEAAAERRADRAA